MFKPFYDNQSTFKMGGTTLSLTASVECMYELLRYVGRPLIDEIIFYLRTSLSAKTPDILLLFFPVTLNDSQRSLLGVN